MQTKHKHAFIIVFIAGFLWWAYGGDTLKALDKQIEISNACDINRTACEMQGVDL
jgi:hypothetical protein